MTDSGNPKQNDQALLSLTIQSTAITLIPATVYSYTVPSTGGYDPAGNLLGYTDATANGGSIMGTWSFQYDSLNRLVSASATAGSYAESTPNLCWAYDSFGNRTMQSAQSAACPASPTPGQPPSTVYYNANNQITFIANEAPTGLPYDAAGNVLASVTDVGQTYYWYDGEGRICAVQNTPVAGMTAAYGYLYDADGARVAKGTVTPSPSPAAQPVSCDPTTNGFQFTENYVLGPGGEELTMLDGNNNWQRTNVYAAGKLLATYDLVGGSPALHFHLTDPLGSRRMQLSGEIANLGQPETDIQSLPFGDGLASFPDQYAATTANDSTPLHFTGKERDQESGNDYFGARYYASSMGRWLSPDWSAKVTPVPYAKLDNPQSLNLYGYVLNNPLSRADADGHCDAPSNLKAGQTGVCVASYISSKKFDVVGDGDNRGTNGNGGTSRIETTFTVDSSGKTEKPADGDKVAQSTVLGMKDGLQGTGSSQVSPGATVDSNGNMHLSVDQSAHSAYDLGGALGDISNHVNLEITPDGKVGVDAGSTARQFPALEIYRYTTDGTTVTTTLVHNYPETTPSALRQPEQPLAPQAPQ